MLFLAASTVSTVIEQYGLLGAAIAALMTPVLLAWNNHTTKRALKAAEAKQEIANANHTQTIGEIHLAVNGLKGGLLRTIMFSQQRIADLSGLERDRVVADISRKAYEEHLRTIAMMDFNKSSFDAGRAAQMAQDNTDLLGRSIGPALPPTPPPLPMGPSSPASAVITSVAAPADTTKDQLRSILF